MLISELYSYSQPASTSKSSIEINTPRSVDIHSVSRITCMTQGLVINDYPWTLFVVTATATHG